MSERLPLSTLLSQALVAFTMEFDNEAERQLAASGSRCFLVSKVMWSNVMRFVDDDGVVIREIPGRAGFPGTPVGTGWMHSCLAGLERWGYVLIGRDPTDRRAKPPRPDLIVRPTAAGRTARAVWMPLAAVIERRWRARFGDDVVEELRAAAAAIVGQVRNELPRSLPVVGHGMRTPAPHLESLSTGPASSAAAAPDVSELLAQVLLLFVVGFERDSALSLAVSANALRVIDDAGTRVRDVPSAAGVSKEATSVALGFLERNGFVVVEADASPGRTKLVRLTQKGLAARAATGPLLAAVEARERATFGADAIERLHAALEALLGNAQLGEGLAPPPAGWRAKKPYTARTAALVASPRAGLPHFPMVTHRGGWPDGS